MTCPENPDRGPCSAALPTPMPLPLTRQHRLAAPPAAAGPVRARRGAVSSGAPRHGRGARRGVALGTSRCSVVRLSTSLAPLPPTRGREHDPPGAPDSQHFLKNLGYSVPRSSTAGEGAHLSAVQAPLTQSRWRATPGVRAARARSQRTPTTREEERARTAPHGRTTCHAGRAEPRPRAVRPSSVSRAGKSELATGQRRLGGAARSRAPSHGGRRGAAGGGMADAQASWLIPRRPAAVRVASRGAEFDARAARPTGPSHVGVRPCMLVPGSRTGPRSSASLPAAGRRLGHFAVPSIAGAR